jgi:BMFP domain-containing protein YqiC
MSAGLSPAASECEMQTQNPFLDEMAKLSTAAMGLAQAAGEEAKAAFRAQADRMAAELDLIRRDDYEALKAEVAALRSELEALKVAQAPKATKPKAAGPKTGGAA